jgi:hypothetical protein
MNEVIHLAVDRYGVNRMTKNLPSLRRGEVPIKLTLTVEDQAFREPVIEKEVHIEDWRQGVDIADVEFKEAVITEEEALRGSKTWHALLTSGGRRWSEVRHDRRRVAAAAVPDLPPPARAALADGPIVLDQGGRAPRAAA